MQSPTPNIIIGTSSGKSLSTSHTKSPSSTPPPSTSASGSYRSRTIPSAISSTESSSTTPAHESSIPSISGTGGGPTSTTPSPGEIRSAVSRYFSAASNAAGLYISASDAVNSLPTSSSQKRSGEANENGILRRDADIQLSILVDAALSATESAAELVPGVPEMEIGIALGPNVLSQLDNVKSYIGTLTTGLKSMQGLVEELLKTPTISIRNSLVALVTGKTLSVALQSLLQDTKWDPAPHIPPPTQLLPTSTLTQTTSSISQKVSETPYVILTNIGTTKANVARLLNGIRAQTSFFDALQVQLIGANLTDSMAKKFSADPIVSLTFPEYELYC